MLLFRLFVAVLTLFMARNIAMTHFSPEDVSYHLSLAERSAEEMARIYARDGRWEVVAGKSAWRPGSTTLRLGLDALAEYQKAVALNPSSAYNHRMMAWHTANLNNLLAYLPGHSFSTSSPLAGEGRDRGKGDKNFRPGTYPKRENLLIPEIIREFQLAVKLNPISSDSHRMFAVWAFHQAGKDRSWIDLGIAEYRQAVALDPSLANEALTRYFQFTHDYRSLKEILPDTPDSVATLAHFLYEHDAWDRNETAFLAEMERVKAQHLRSRSSNSENEGLSTYYRTLAGIYQKKEEYDKAISALLEYLEMQPEDAEAHFRLAGCSFYHGRQHGYFWAFSKLHHQKAIELSPDNAFFHKWYGRRLYYKREFQEAASRLRRAVELAPKDHEARSWLEESYRKAAEYGLPSLNPP
ncbi:MAG: hypothetical protein ACE5JO_03520 [Candidatus Binatia bacterium]